MLDHATDQIGRLSGGQQQRVFIARALAQDADVLLLDEPMTGIDESTQQLIAQVIEEERQGGKIVLMATHDLPETFDGPVIVLGPVGTPAMERWQHTGIAAHHLHQHENMGRDHH
jgi:ABC-type Mn2+/Zn2+ transport system ATPase subunit